MTCYNNIRRTLCNMMFALLLLSATAANGFAQSARQTSLLKNINLSLWKNLSTQHTDTVGTTWLNIGVFSSQNRLHGLGVNILASVVERDMHGVQLSGLANLTGEHVHGIQISSITNVCGSGIYGLSATGLVAIAGTDTRGAVFSGLATITGEEARGVAASGMLNICGQSSVGFRLAGMADIVADDFHGVSLGGLLNIVAQDMTGVQIAGIGNVTVRKMRGMQLAALGNVTGGEMCGVQIGMANMAGSGKGIQIGLFNYYHKKLDGIQLGLVNMNPHTRVQMLIFSGNKSKLNVGARFKNNSLYTIIGGGTHYLEGGSRFSMAMFYRAGMEFLTWNKFGLSGDLGFQHVETFKNRHREGIPAHLYALQARINIEYRMNAASGLFLTCGYNADKQYGHSGCYDKGALIEGGIVLFRY